MPCINQDVEVRDTVIQQVLLTSVPPPFPTMEYNVTVAILKYYGQKEDDAAPPVALWYSWLYRGWKADMGMVNPLLYNW